MQSPLPPTRGAGASLSRPTLVAAALYVAAIVTANLSIWWFGPASAPINAFLLIGFDLALRDWLHVKLPRWAMFALILLSAALTYAVNPAAQGIAMASAVAFAAASIVDMAVFAAAARKSWLARSNLSNAAGALVDSVVFPTLAFGAILPGIVAAQFVAKVAGGFVWAALIWLVMRRRQGRLAS